MAFSEKQIKALKRKLDHRYVRTREVSGREFSYIEGWYAISEANRIFGFDGWNRETIDSRCVLARENRGSFVAVYTARVRISVQANGTTIIREGHGTGEGRGASPGEVHDTALKAAETDATKRALATFGKPFGLALYRSVKPTSPEPDRLVHAVVATAEHRLGFHPIYNSDSATVAVLWSSAVSSDNGTASERRCSFCSTTCPGTNRSKSRSDRQKRACDRPTEAAA
jgi:DNA recombination protein Rad52